MAHQLDNHVIDPGTTSELSSQLLSAELAKESAAEVSRLLSTWASVFCSSLTQPICAAHPLPSMLPRQVVKQRSLLFGELHSSGRLLKCLCN